MGMVDDILSITKCSTDAVKINGVMNGFIESKKLTLSHKKCHRIHISKNPKKNKECKELKVHEKKISNSEKEKYLGDIVDKLGKAELPLRIDKRKVIE